MLAYALTGKEISRTGNAKPREIVPYDTYYCADDFIAVGINDESMWPDFCDALEMPELKDDPLYATNDLRCSNFEGFTKLMQGVFKEKTAAWLLERFSQFNIPASVIVDPVDDMTNPQMLARDMIIDIDDPNVCLLYTSCPKSGINAMFREYFIPSAN